MSVIVLCVALSKGLHEFWKCHCIVMLLCNQCLKLILVMKLECFCLSIGYHCSLQLDFWGQYGHYVTWVSWEVPEATHLCTGSLGTRLAVHVRWAGGCNQNLLKYLMVRKPGTLFWKVNLTYQKVVLSSPDQGAYIVVCTKVYWSL